MPDQSSRFAVGSRVGPYALLKWLGSGAFGEVWLAEKESALVQTRLAVKLPTARSVDLEALRREAALWVRAANHPNVLPLFEANVYDGQAVIVSEFAPDGSLSEFLKAQGGQAPSLEAGVEVAIGMLSGLEHLHVRGVIHRDLKPANILMQGGAPRIADFGLACLSDPSATWSQAAGTPAYMAPEAFDGQRTAQTDVWSAGVILYQLLSGSLPFPADELLQLMKALTTQPPRPLPASIPQAVQQALQTALEKHPAARFRTAADMRAALRDALRFAEIVPAPARTLPKAPRAIAVTGSMDAPLARTDRRIRALLTPHFAPETTWYCGTAGTVDECAARYLLEAGQRLIVVGYSEHDLSAAMRQILAGSDVPFVDAQHEQVPQLPDAPSQRDIFFSTKADLLILGWDGVSAGTAALLAWLRTQHKDHVVGFV